MSIKIKKAEEKSFETSFLLNLLHKPMFHYKPDSNVRIGYILLFWFFAFTAIVNAIPFHQDYPFSFFHIIHLLPQRADSDSERYNNADHHQVLKYLFYALSQECVCFNSSNSKHYRTQKTMWFTSFGTIFSYQAVYLVRLFYDNLAFLLIMFPESSWTFFKKERNECLLRLILTYVLPWKVLRIKMSQLPVKDCIG